MLRLTKPECLNNSGCKKPDAMVLVPGLIIITLQSAYLAAMSASASHPFHFVLVFRNPGLSVFFDVLLGSLTLVHESILLVDIRVIDTGRDHPDEDFVLVRRGYRDVGLVLELVEPVLAGQHHRVHGFWNVDSHAPVSSTR